MFHFMKKMVMTAVMFGVVFAQSPIIRVKQIGEWKTPEYWWKAQETIDLQDFLADDISQPAYLNNNFDSWRDDILEMEVTIDDNGADLTAFRFDIAFDNDLITWVEPNTNDEDADENDIAAETEINAWNQGNSRVVKGSHIVNWDEGDQNDDSDYSFEVVYFSNVGYQDSIQDSGNEESETDSDYDWLRITMVSHGHDDNNDGTPDKIFGNGDGNEVQVLKLRFRINDVVDNYQPHSFRIPTLYSGGSGYYTYLSDDYLLDYKVYIDGNWGTDSTNNGGARGDITLHPKLVDVEGFARYIGEKSDTDGDGVEDDTFTQNTYPFWKVVFELDENNPDQNSNWYNIEDVADDASGNADEDLSDDVIGDDSGTYYYHKITDTTSGTTTHQALPGNGFLGVSYWDYTYTDKNGYYNIQLPRNNNYRISFWPPDSLDVIGGFIKIDENNDYKQKELDRYAVTNINDAIASFNFQSNKFENDDDINVDSPSAYLIGDVDGDDVFQLNDTYFLWAYVSGVFDTSYEHINGNTYQQWSSIDNLKSNGNAENLNYYQALRGGDTKQRREFSVFWDDNLDQETETLTTDGGGVAWFNPLMDDVQTGQDTLNVSIGAGTSTFDDPDVEDDGDVNPDKIIDDIAYYFTGDINLTGTKVKSGNFSDSDWQDDETLDEDGANNSDNSDGEEGGNSSDNDYEGQGNDDSNADVNSAVYDTQHTEVSTYYRWDTHTVGNGDSGDNSWNQNCVNTSCGEEPSAWTETNTTTGHGSNGQYDGSSRTMNRPFDVRLSLPGDGSVKARMGSQVSVPLTIEPYTDLVTGELTKIAGFEFEVRFDTNHLKFIDAQTGLLPGPWMTYLNESEVDDEGFKTISFGALDNSPNNAPQDYYITEEMIGLELLFESLQLNSTEQFITADLQFVGKANAGNPNGDDLIMTRSSGNIRIWNEYWAFGGGRPDEDELTYVYPNPYKDDEHNSLNFQFYMVEAGDVIISIYNPNGQKVSELLNQQVGQGLQTFTFSDLPNATGDYNGYEELDSGIYIFVLETENRIKSKKFTILK